MSEFLEYLADYLDENEVQVVAKSGSPGVVSMTGFTKWLDMFERDELYDSVDGEREKLRDADATIRALTRQLSKELDC